MKFNRQQKRTRRHQHVRKTVQGTLARPRLAVYRSNAHIYAQVIDDINGRTICAASDLKLDKGTKAEKAALVGETIAKAAQKANIKQVVFDRAGFKFHGRIKGVAEAARAAGLDF